MNRAVCNEIARTSQCSMTMPSSDVVRIMLSVVGIGSSMKE